MKKLFLILSIGVALLACKTSKQWTPEQRQQLREQIRAYREWSYLQNMNDAEFMLFTDDVAAMLEAEYANYTVLSQIPSMQDSLTQTVIVTLGNYVTTDARNMRYLFPYTSLVNGKVLPSGLSRDQIKEYYTCLADKINNGYTSMEAFLWAAMQNNVDSTMVGAMQRECAASLALDINTHADFTTMPGSVDHDKSMEHKDKDKKSATKQ